MKHILSALAVAFAFTAVTASAANYYDYYETATNTDFTETRDNKNDPGKTYVAKGIVTNYGGYQVIRTSYPNDSELQHDSLYKIRITGKSVDLYLTDYIDNTGSPNNGNALENKPISQYGYHYLDSNDPDKVDTTVRKDLVADSTPIDSHYFEPNQWYTYTVVRNQYFLGTFSAGDEIELLMKDNGGNEVLSYSTWYKGGYADGVTTTDATDKLMMYYKGGDAEAAQKAMPLAALDPGSRVFFGIYGQVNGGETFGTPLPGGTAIYVAAALFALGFYFFRRRKALAV